MYCIQEFGDSNEHGLRAEAVLFDMDGVLLDSMPWHVKAWQDACDEFGLPRLEEEKFYLHEGAIEPETAVDIFRQEGVDMTPNLFAKILQRQKEIFKSRYRDRVHPFPQVPSILEELNDMGLSMALVTSSHRDVLDRVLPSYILDYMAVIITGDEVARRKPWPDPYLQAMERLSVPPSLSVVVENAPAGIESAKRAKAFCLALATTLDPKHLARADAVLLSHSEIPKALPR